MIFFTLKRALNNSLIFFFYIYVFFLFKVEQNCQSWETVLTANLCLCWKTKNIHQMKESLNLILLQTKDFRWNLAVKLWDFFYFILSYICKKKKTVSKNKKSW